MGRRSRGSSPVPAETAEIVAYNWGGAALDFDNAAMLAWVATHNRPNEGMGEAECEAWEHLGYERWWRWASAGMNDRAANE